MSVRQRKTTFPFCSLPELRVNKAKICFVDLQSPRRFPMQFVSTCEPINANVVSLAFISALTETRNSDATEHAAIVFC